MLKRIFIGVLVFVVALAGGAYLIPREVHFERSVVIDAPQESVFDLLNSFKRFNDWSPWYEHDPEVATSFEGPEAGLGARMTWSSKKLGNGSNTITESEPSSFIRTKLVFEGKGEAESFFNLSHAEEESTEVVWGFKSDLGMNPINRYCGLIMKRMIAKDYERGLVKLKSTAEAEG